VKKTPEERTSWETTTRSMPLMTKVPLSVMIGTSPSKFLFLFFSRALVDELRLNAQRRLKVDVLRHRRLLVELRSSM